MDIAVFIGTFVAIFSWIGKIVLEEKKKQAKKLASQS